MILEEAKLFFDDFSGNATADFFSLPQSGSSRQNFIAKTNHKTYVVTYNENLRENESFFYFSNVFSDLNLNTPYIFKISEDRKLYIQEFVGAQTLSEVIEKEGLSDCVKPLVKQTLDKIFKLQNDSLGTIDYSKTFEYEKYDRIPIFHDLNYFKFFFVDVLEIPYHKSTLLKEFEKIAALIENLQPQALMIRDFQARNIMVDNDNQVFFIDYQSAMFGPMMYDVVSFLFQAKANFPEEFKNEMLQYYISKFNNDQQVHLNFSVLPIRLIRNLQVLGAYGFRGLVQKKEHFIKSIEKGIENAKETSANWDEMNNFPELKNLIENISWENIKPKITTS